jgi:hypothetical protein
MPSAAHRKVGAGEVEAAEIPGKVNDIEEVATIVLTWPICLKQIARRCFVTACSKSIAHAAAVLAGDKHSHGQ